MLCCTMVRRKNKYSILFYSILLTPHPPLRPASPPATKAGGTHSPGGEGDGGSIFWKTREIGLPSYSKICTLWRYYSGQWYHCCLSFKSSLQCHMRISELCWFPGRIHLLLQWDDAHGTRLSRPLCNRVQLRLIQLFSAFIIVARKLQYFTCRYLEKNIEKV